MKGVSVVVITLNEERHLAHILGDLERQTAKEFEVIVVDSRSTDSTVAVARSFLGRLPLRIVEMSRRGTSLGRNTGAAQARYERLLFLDADTRLDPGFLEEAVEELDSRHIQIGGVYMRSSGSSLPVVLGILAFNAGLCFGQYLFPMATGACLFSTRTVHGEIGGFDESIVLCEDCDYVRRASKTKTQKIRFGMLRKHFYYHPRRLEQDGLLRTGWTYLRANLHRLFLGELYGNPYLYRFAHYDTSAKGIESDV
ncbi:MAG: glycosyltransferase [Synergistaceae bacterium]|jgi:glycosyltransferase involved in cell wall biosynthesis|nr:glycosyltransferase [Synergistaceae bacterium]